MNYDTIKFKKINPEFSETLKMYNNGKTNYLIKCPCCESTDLVCHGYYKRKVSFKFNNIIISRKITIKRVKCKSCHHTHALLPMDIVPYKNATLSIIINCIFNDKFFYDSSFSYDVREKWIKQFKCFLPYIKTMITNKDKIYENFKKNFNEFYHQFYLKTNKILFMFRKAFFNVGLL